MKPIKIAYCTPSLYLPGGVERILTTKMNYLAEVANCDICVILTDGVGKKPYYELSPKVKVINLDINFEALWGKSFFQKILIYLRKQHLYKKKLTRTLFQIKPDITVSLLRREINFITSIQDGSIKIGELHVNKKNYRNFEEDEINTIKKVFSKIWMKQLIRKLKKLDKFVVLSQEDKENWHELNNVIVISNFIPFKTDKISSLSTRKVIAAGRFVYQKGFDLLLKAWQKVTARHKDWELYIYGKGDKTSCLNYIKQEQLANVHIEEATPNIINKYCDSSIFAFSSRFEGFGLVLAEAMSCGLPAVSFACPCGPRDIITDGEDGFLVEPENITMFADKLCWLIEHDEQRKRMGQKAHQDMQRFREETIMQQWMALFESLLP